MICDRVRDIYARLESSARCYNAPGWDFATRPDSVLSVARELERVAAELRQEARPERELSRCGKCRNLLDDDGACIRCEFSDFFSEQIAKGNIGRLI